MLIYINYYQKNGIRLRINNSIPKGQTVKEFLEDLYNKYNSSNNADKNKENMNFSQNSFDDLDIFANYLKNNNDKYDNGISSLQKNKIIT